MNHLERSVIKGVKTLRLGETKKCHRCQLHAQIRGGVGEYRGHDRSQNRQERRFSDRTQHSGDAGPLPSFHARVTARELAVEQLLRVEEEGGFVGRMGSQTGLKGRQGQREAALTPSERRDLTVYVAQVTRLRMRLDWRLQQLLQKSTVAQLQPTLRQILRLGIYEIFEDKMPAHVVNVYIDLADKMVGEWSKKFANGLLRSACRAREEGPLVPPRPPPDASLGQRVEAMAIVYSHPQWMVAKWLQQFGMAATEKLLLANNSFPVYGLRANSLKGVSSGDLAGELHALGLDVGRSSLLPDEFLQISGGLQTVLRSGLAEDGRCMVQDEAAGVVVALLDPQPGETILDACAAPGGKTLFTAARMQNQGTLLAMDLHARKLRALHRAARKCGVGPMLLIAPGTVQDFAEGRVSVDLSDPRSRPPWGPEAGREMGLDRIEGLGSSRTSDSIPAGPRWQGGAEAADREGEGWGSGGAVDAYEPDDLEAAMSTAGHSPQSDGVEGGQIAEKFDRVLLDVPCSGLGVLSKRADLRWRREPQNFKQILLVQAELLRAAAKVVKPGGLLVYSTCSIEPEENEGQVVAFLRAHRDFSLEPVPSGLLPPEVVYKSAYLATFPHIHGVDGAFGARLRKAPSRRNSLR